MRFLKFPLLWLINVNNHKQIFGHDFTKAAQPALSNFSQKCQLNLAVVVSVHVHVLRCMKTSCAPRSTKISYTSYTLTQISSPMVETVKQSMIPVSGIAGSQRTLATRMRLNIYREYYLILQGCTTIFQTSPIPDEPSENDKSIEITLSELLRKRLVAVNLCDRCITHFQLIFGPPLYHSSVCKSGEDRFFWQTIS